MLGSGADLGLKLKVLSPECTDQWRHFYGLGTGADNDKHFFHASLISCYFALQSQVVVESVTPTGQPILSGAKRQPVPEYDRTDGSASKVL
jgi:hypothetical protein